MTASILKFDKSLKQARWIFPTYQDDHVHRAMSDYNLPEIVARLLVARNVPHEKIDGFLNPKLAKDFPDPFSLKTMPEFADFIADAIVKGRKIAALCDFDVDGSTSAAILKKLFAHLKIDLPVYIPCRMTEGYGPNAKALQTLKDQGAEIVIMADCGTTAFDVIEYGRNIGLDICVLDHHEQGEDLPLANFVINPKRRDCQSGLPMLAACGVAFLACVAINTRLREWNYYADRGLTEAPLKSWLDLVALGTVCDMVPLTGPNRLFVKFGFQQMAKGQNIGLKALCAVGNIKKPPTPEDAGFVLGPRINAGSRVHQADLGAKLLSCEDEEEAKNLAWLLHDCNLKRRNIQAEMLREAVAQVERNGYHEDPIIMVHDPLWHVGLNGLVAGQLKEKYGKPACVIAFAPGMDGRMEGRGSGRSVSGFNMAALFMAAKQANLVVKGGGHAMAAGFTVYEETIAELHEFFKSSATKSFEGIEILNDEAVDSIASIRGLRPDFIRLLENNVGPFGQENPEPRFVLANTKIVSADIVGENHIRLLITDMEGGSRIKAIAFKSVDTPMGQVLLDSRGRNLHFMGQFKVNEWNGTESVEFHVADVAIPA